MSTTVYREFDQAALDAQYNILGMIPGYQEVYDRWHAASAKTMQAATAKGQVSYHYGPFPAQDLDLFRTEAANGPLVIFIHGGYWRSQDKSWFSHVAEPYCARGCNVAVINYRLTPRVTMDQIVDDVRACTVWLSAHAQELGFDADRIFVAGSSAGGHLTAALLATPWAELGVRADIVKGGCALSGLYDLEPIRLCFLNQVVGLDAAMARRQSPQHHVPKTAAPLILSVGGIESPEFHRQQDDYAQAWRAQGLECRVVTQDGGHHFDMIDRWSDENHPLFKAFMEMIASHAAVPR